MLLAAGLQMTPEAAVEVVTIGLITGRTPPGPVVRTPNAPGLSAPSCGQSIPGAGAQVGPAFCLPTPTQNLGNPEVEALIRKLSELAPPQEPPESLDKPAPAAGHSGSGSTP